MEKINTLSSVSDIVLTKKNYAIINKNLEKDLVTKVWDESDVVGSYHAVYISVASHFEPNISDRITYELDNL